MGGFVDKNLNSSTAFSLLASELRGVLVYVCKFSCLSFWQNSYSLKLTIGERCIVPGMSKALFDLIDSRAA